jgi:hypothetical protein
MIPNYIAEFSGVMLMAIPEAPETSTLSTSTSAGSVDSGLGRVLETFGGKPLPGKSPGGGSSCTYITSQSSQPPRTIPSNPAMHSKILGKKTTIQIVFFLDYRNSSCS